MRGRRAAQSMMEILDVVQLNLRESPRRMQDWLVVDRLSPTEVLDLVDPPRLGAPST